MNPFGTQCTPRFCWLLRKPCLAGYRVRQSQKKHFAHAQPNRTKPKTSFYKKFERPHDGNGNYWKYVHFLVSALILKVFIHLFPQWSFWGGPESSEVNMPFQIKNIGNTSNGKLRLWWVPGKRKIFLLTEIVASVVGKLQSVLSNSPNLTFCSPETEIMIAPLFVVWFWFCKSGMMRFCINNDIMIHF